LDVRVSGQAVEVVIVCGTSVISVFVELPVEVTGYVSVQVERETLWVQTQTGFV